MSSKRKRDFHLSWAEGGWRLGYTNGCNSSPFSVRLMLRFGDGEGE